MKDCGSLHGEIAERNRKTMVIKVIESFAS